MPFSSGVFSRIYSWVTDAGNGLNIDATRMDTDSNDIASGLSTCVLKDGTQTITANIPMSGFKFTGLALGTASNDSASVQNILVVESALMHICDFRLTMVSGNPVGEATGTTLYCSPYKGNTIALYDGSSSWGLYASAEFSIALGTLTANLPYDVFCYANSGVPTLEILAWTNTTTRATALTTQNGVLVKTGATTRRYLGTFYTISTTQTQDSNTGRYLWNYYNRIRRLMAPSFNGSAYTYTTNTIRQANGNVANQLNFVMGVQEDTVCSSCRMTAANTNTGVAITSGLGLDTTTSFTSGGACTVTTAIANGNLSMTSTFEQAMAPGLHFISVNEVSAATGTTTWAPAVAGGGGWLIGNVLA